MKTDFYHVTVTALTATEETYRTEGDQMRICLSYVQHVDGEEQRAQIGVRAHHVFRKDGGMYGRENKGGGGKRG